MSARCAVERMFATATSTSTSARSTPHRLQSKESDAYAATSRSMPHGSTSRAFDSTATTRCEVSGFSGGERSRLALAKLLLEPRNLLFLDEPTNHLDIPAAEILEEALSAFEGTVFLVSHDRRFLQAVTTRVIHVRGGEVDIYPGGFRDYQEALERASLRATSDDTSDATGQTLQSPGASKEPASPGRAVRRSASTKPLREKRSQEVAEDNVAARRRSFEAEKAQSRAVDRKRKRLREIEAEIAVGEAELACRREALKEHPGGDWAKLAELAKQEQALAKRVDIATTEWMTLSEELANEASAGGALHES